MAHVKPERQRKTTEYDYAYATGRIRELENDLMDEQATMRLFDANSIDEIIKILLDNGYKATESIDRAIKEDMEDSFALIESIIPDKEYVQSLLLENDYHNLKVILKSIIPKSYDQGQSSNQEQAIDPDEELRKEEDISDILEDSKKDISIKSLENYFALPSNYEPMDLLKLIFDQEMDFPDKAIGDLIKETLIEFKRTNDPSVIDTVIDKRYFDRLYEYSNALENDFFMSYITFLSESTNLDILLRSKKMNFNSQFFLDTIVYSSIRTRDEMIELFELSLEEVADAYKDTFCEKLGQMAPEYSNGNNAIKYAKEVDNLIIQMIKETKSTLFGPEIALAYLIAKQMQAKNINIALTCLRNKLSKNMAYELMRDTF